jgi:predicted nucleotidyltransferase
MQNYSKMKRNLSMDIPREKIKVFCQKHSIRKLSVFGSALSDDFGSDSDIDILVEFFPDRAPGLIRLAGVEIELSDILGRKVDLRTPQDLSRYFRQEVVDSAEVQYVDLQQRAHSPELERSGNPANRGCGVRERILD